MARSVVNDIHLLRFAVEMFFQDSDDEENGNGPLDKVWGYAEETVPNFTDRQFQAHFRMTPTTFECVYNKLQTLFPNYRIDGNPEISVEKQLMLTLWYLGNIESFRGVADRFGISRSTAWKCFYKVCNRMLGVNRRFKIINFPDNEKCIENINAFQNRYGFPGVIGALDGSHIPIIAPKQNPAAYINRKSYHSVILQAACDYKKMFFDVYAGEVGSVHDACVFRRSELQDKITEVDLPQNGHLLGDSAYSLTNKLLVPFKNNGHLSDIQKSYNKKHAKTRAVIENSFSLLKGRFRRLKLVEAVNPRNISLMIVAACIFHNFCLMANDIPLDINMQEEVNEERIMRPPNVGLHERGNNPIAIGKRMNVANIIYYNELQM